MNLHADSEKTDVIFQEEMTGKTTKEELKVQFSYSGTPVTYPLIHIIEIWSE